MISDLPDMDYFQDKPADELIDTASLTLQQRGIWRTLLLHLRRQRPPGSMPFDENGLVRLLGITFDEWRSVRWSVLALFRYHPATRQICHIPTLQAYVQFVRQVERRRFGADMTNAKRNGRKKLTLSARSADAGRLFIPLADPFEMITPETYARIISKHLPELPLIAQRTPSDATTTTTTTREEEVVVGGQPALDSGVASPPPSSSDEEERARRIHEAALRRSREQAAVQLDWERQHPKKTPIHAIVAQPSA